MNRYFKFSISLMTLLGLVYAQSSVQGTVKDGSGNPLSGANVVVDVLPLVQQLLQMEVTVLTLDQVRSVVKLLRLPHLTLDIVVKP